MPSKREQELKPLADALTEIISGMLERKSIKLAGKPTVERKDIIEWNNKMRITGMEKFNSTTYISFIHYYLNEQEKGKNNAHGAAIIFVPESELVSLLGKLEYPKFDDESVPEMEQSCGKFCTDIAQAFSKKLVEMGYPSLLMSGVNNFRNNVTSGVGFHIKEYDKFEIGFAVEGRKLMFAEVTMGVLPKK